MTVTKVIQFIKMHIAARIIFQLFSLDAICFAVTSVWILLKVMYFLSADM